MTNEASPQTDEHATLQANQSTSPAAPMHANASYLRHHQPAYSAAFRLPSSGSEPDKALGNAASQPPPGFRRTRAIAYANENFCAL